MKEKKKNNIGQQNDICMFYYIYTQKSLVIILQTRTDTPCISALVSSTHFPHNPLSRSQLAKLQLYDYIKLILYSRRQCTEDVV